MTGRLLVGLRWWNQIDEDGTSHWVFEARRVRMITKIGSGQTRVHMKACKAHTNSNKGTKKVIVTKMLNI